MSSPFPGVDPYLEGSRWPSVQTQLSVEIARTLAPSLRPTYVVRALPRVYEAGDFGKVWSILVNRYFPSVTIEIRTPAAGTLATVIDILLATDKEDGPGREGYLGRRKRLLQLPTNLVEVDLLRSGKRTPLPEPLARDPYRVMVSRATNDSQCDVWSFKLTDPLPVVPIPIGEADHDMPLDLNRALMTVHSVFGYDLDVQYDRSPEAPLDTEQFNWSQHMIQMWRDEQK